jgi:5-methylcytosine-specific restriction endonuclease McrA
MNAHSLQSLSDDQLLAQLAAILRDSRRAEADLVAHIAAVDERRLYLREACPSMFSYCVERLNLSEPETALRIVVARASLRHPVLLDMLRDGRLHLSGIALLAPHLTERNRDALLSRATQLSKRRIEELVAELAPRPDAPALVRKLPAPSPAQHRPDDARPLQAPGGAPPLAIARAPSSAASPTLRKGPPATVEPLAPARYRVQFTASRALRDKLEELQALMRSSVPDGDLAAVIEAAVSEKIERLKARRLAATPRPRTTLARSDTRPGPRHIPAAVKRAVRERDGDRCAYVDPQGRRCSERRGLQFHHRHPHGYGGDRSEDNIALRCGGHNRYEADRDFGRRPLGGGGRRPQVAPPAVA